MAVHIVAEGLALVGLVPLTLWAATRRRALTPLERGALVAVGAAVVLVDGALLYRNIRRVQAES